MPTVQQMIDKLSELPKDYEIVIYPKYSSHKVNGFCKHKFNIDNVCLQEPKATEFKDDPVKLKKYLGKSYEDYEVNNHVAIVF